MKRTKGGFGRGWLSRLTVLHDQTARRLDRARKVLGLLPSGSWRFAIAIAAVLAGLYLGLHDLVTDRGVVQAALLVLAGVSVALTAVRTQKWSELLSVDETERVLPKIVCAATIISVVFNSSAANQCLLRVHPVLSDRGLTAKGWAGESALDAEESKIADRLIHSCGFSPEHDAAQVGAELATAESDHMIAEHVEAEPAFVRRVFDWTRPEPEDACIAAYHQLKAKRFDVFGTNAPELACVDKPHSLFHL